MLIGVLKEQGLEQRVALSPAVVAQFVKLNVDVWVEQGAGERAFSSNQEYEAAGAQIKSSADILTQATLVLQIQAPAPEAVKLFRKDLIWVSVLNPYSSAALVSALRDQGVTAFGMDIIPRTTRAQSMDILSSMATVSGYKAVLMAALELPRFFPMFMTAAGTITPAKVMILGAGVAGLQAVATARKLGAVVEVFDVRAAVKEEVLSLGGKFIEVEGATDDKAAGGYAVEQTEEFKQRQADAIHQHAIKSDVIICTAQIPGRKAPLLIRTATVEAMRSGSVIVDLAASTGGNCELTKDQQTISHHNIKIIGNSNLPWYMSSDASSMDKEGALNLNFEDDIVKGTCVTHAGAVINDKVKTALNL
jgi:NAD(P) transhydrogenase subunit alpha